MKGGGTMTNFYKQIIVAVDFSEASKLAFERAAAIAAAYDATLTIVSVIDDRSAASVATYDKKYIDELTTEYNEKLDRAKEKAASLGVNDVRVLIEVGSPKQILTSFDDADLIVCGATGLNAAERLFIGSISEGIVRKAACDVLIVRVKA